VPVTAKLSKRFYEVLGEDVANELVDWFNLVDATYRSDLRELNELNFARFDAKVEQRFAESEAKWERRFAEVETKWERRFAGFETKWEQRFGELETRWERRFAGFETMWERRFVGLESKVEQRTFELRQEILGLRADSEVAIERTRAELIRWMFLFWLGSVAASVLTRVL
jgi:hypothetical protein